MYIVFLFVLVTFSFNVLDSFLMNSINQGVGELTKAQKQRAEIAREYFANRREQTKVQKQQINNR